MPVTMKVTVHEAPTTATDPERVKYAIFYRSAQAIVTAFDPCQIHKNEKGKLVCVGGEPCCDGCKHLDPKKGCTVKSLPCKVWLCIEAQMTLTGHAAHKALQAVGNAAAAEGLPTWPFRTSEDEYFQALLEDRR